MNRPYSTQSRCQAAGVGAFAFVRFVKASQQQLPSYLLVSNRSEGLFYSDSFR